MGQSLFSYSFFERRKLNFVLQEVIQRYGDAYVSLQQIKETVNALETKTQQDPTEWVYWYALSDNYYSLGQYNNAVKASETAYGLRPRDPRSPYGLATILRELTNARYVGNPEFPKFRNKLSEDDKTRYYDPDPSTRQKVLDELEMTIDQAAERSLLLFEEVVTYAIPSEEKIHVNDILAQMYTNFPHLEESVKSKRKQGKGLFDLDRNNPYNEAMEHFRKLRYLYGRGSCVPQRSAGGYPIVPVGNSVHEKQW
jgi:tetratricopeptide (TPR) repeat protein